MTKAEIATEIAKTTGIDKAAVLSVVEQFMAVVKDSLAHGENVYLRGFGSFIVKTRAEKTARNISKNTTLIIPAHNIPAFKPPTPSKKKLQNKMDNKYNENGDNPVDDMTVDYDYHVNTGDLPELFDEASIDDFIANLNYWD